MHKNLSSRFTRVKRQVRSIRVLCNIIIVQVRLGTSLLHYLSNCVLGSINIIITYAYDNTYYDFDSNNPHIIMCAYITENKKNSVIVIIIITEGQTEFKCNTVNDSIVRI